MGELGIAIEQSLGSGARAGAKLLVAKRIGNAKGRHAALPFAEQVAHPAKTEIGAGDLEAVVGIGKDPQALPRLGPDIAEKNAVRRFSAAPNTAR